MVKPSKNPAMHWSGWSLKNGLVTNGPKKKVKNEQNIIAPMEIGVLR